MEYTGDNPSNPNISDGAVFLVYNLIFLRTEFSRNKNW
jgi:hypothetical protein